MNAIQKLDSGRVTLKYIRNYRISRKITPPLPACFRENVCEIRPEWWGLLLVTAIRQAKWYKVKHSLRIWARFSVQRPVTLYSTPRQREKLLRQNSTLFVGLTITFTAA